MSKAVKAAAGVAVGSAALLGAVSGIAYECILNVRLAAKISEHFSPAQKDSPEEETKEENVTAAKTEAPENANNNETEIQNFQQAVALWHTEHSASDVYISGTDGKKRHAKVFDNGHPDKWAIVFHGYTSGPEGMYHYAYTYGEMGFNCLLPSMIGHAYDENRYCSMGFHDKTMGVDWINYLTEEYPDCEIVIHGESMGAATTMLITGESLPENVKCAVSDCGYSNVNDEYTHVAKNQITPLLVPLLPAISKYSELRGNLNFKKCSPRDAVAHSVTPTLFVHGEKDDFVPFEMLNEVYSACSAEKDYFTVKQAAHAQSSTIAPKQYWTNVFEFVKKYIEL